MVAHRALTPEIFVQLGFPQPDYNGGSTKKVNFKRLLKCSSCLFAVAFVLFATLYIPVNAAAWTTLNPADYIDNVYYSGNFRCVSYDFGTEPYVTYRCGSHTTGDKGSLSVTYSAADGTMLQYRGYPLGKEVTFGPPLTSGVSAIDVADFKNNAALTLESKIDIEFLIGYASYEQYLDESVQVAAVWSLAGYDASGSYKGTVDSLTSAYTLTLQDVEESFYEIELPFSMTLVVGDIADNIRYVIPNFQLVVTVVNNESEIEWIRTYFKCDNFRLITRLDMLLESSLTMKRVEDQLADLNDKTDIIISGTPEQNSEANDKLSSIGNSSQSYDSMMSDLDSMTNYDTDQSFTTIVNFLASPAWKDITGLLDPVISWEHTGMMMLIAAAFATISIILFGR